MLSIGRQLNFMRPSSVRKRCTSAALSRKARHSPSQGTAWPQLGTMDTSELYACQEETIETTQRLRAAAFVAVYEARDVESLKRLAGVSQLPPPFEVR